MWRKGRKLWLTAVGIAIVFAGLASSARAEGWRYPDEPCQWTAKATATEEWYTTTPRVSVWAYADGCPEDSITVIAATTGSVAYSFDLIVPPDFFAEAHVGIKRNERWILGHTLSGDDMGPYEYSGSGSFQVDAGDVVSAYAHAYDHMVGFADAWASLSHSWLIPQHTPRTATSGPSSGTVNAREGAKYMGTFTPQPQPEAGGTLDPATYSLIDVTPPAHGSVWIEQDGRVFAQTAPIRTWDLLVVSENPGFGVAVAVAPTDLNGNGNGTTPFVRVYDTDAEIVLVAPAEVGGHPFSQWEDGSGGLLARNVRLIAAINGDTVCRAVYRPPPVFVITWPTTGTVWQAGTWGNFTFTAANLPSAGEMLIELWQADGGKVASLGRAPCREGANTTPRQLPADVPAGYYRIRLFWAENVAVNVWSDAFTVSPPPAFEITWPTTATVWQPETWADLTFTATNLPSPGEVLVELWQANGGKVASLGRAPCREGANTTPRQLPADVPAGYYRIRLFWAENVAVNVWSGTFMTAPTNAKRWELFR